MQKGKECCQHVGLFYFINMVQIDCWRGMITDPRNHVFLNLFQVVLMGPLLQISDLYIIINQMVSSCMQIVNWRTHLKFPEEVKLSAEAKDLICKLLCNVERRLGTKGAHEIKVSRHRLSSLSVYWCNKWVIFSERELTWISLCRHMHGLKAYNGIGYIKWKLLLYPRLMMS